MFHGKIENAIQQQLKLNQTKNLLHSDISLLLDIEPTFLAALEEALKTPEPLLLKEHLMRLVSFTAESLIEKIYSINQYLQVDRSSRESLQEIYLLAWEELFASKDVEKTLRSCLYPLLAEWIRKLYPDGIKAAIAAKPEIGSVVCRNYSAGFQLDLFGLDPRAIMQPVLDIGCGASAELVRHLRRSGIEAYGLDRSLKAKKPYLLQGDWLQDGFEPSKWGTVISHLAFSNHFIYVEKYDETQRSRYIDKYREILHSLKPRGSFVYAPASSALEKGAVEKRFTVENVFIGNGYGFTKVSRIE